jgi:8-oxo-dGTP pyrophosphatase MutT (NUDIX family)
VSNDARAGAKPSASIVLLRDGPGAPELLMAKRRAGDAFGETYTFPGGVVDSDEDLAYHYASGRSRDDSARLLCVADGLSYYSAAIRELFEETGVLLARRVVDGDNGELAEYQQFRRAIDRGELPWAAFLERFALAMTCDALHYFAHWETPVALPKRWSTRFFLAQMPANQDATLDGNELTDLVWMPAQDILTASRDGLMAVPYPTMRILRDLAPFSSTAEMLAWSDALAKDGRIRRMLMVRVVRDGKTFWLDSNENDRSGKNTLPGS